MISEDLVKVAGIRHGLALSQAELADLIGVSARAVQSWEQGWRKPSAAFEKALLLLEMAVYQGENFGSRVCWEVTHCPQGTREARLAYRARQGHLCCFFTGNLCRGRRLRTWEDKKAMGMECSFSKSLLAPRPSLG